MGDIVSEWLDAPIAGHGLYARYESARTIMPALRDRAVAAEALVEALTEERDASREVVKFYADPYSYFAIAFFADPPCGDFNEDFDWSWQENDWTDGPYAFNREMPGAKARAFLDRLVSGDPNGA